MSVRLLQRLAADALRLSAIDAERRDGVLARGTTKSDPFAMLDHQQERRRTSVQPLLPCGTHGDSGWLRSAWGEHNLERAGALAKQEVGTPIEGRELDRTPREALKERGAGRCHRQSPRRISSSSRHAPKTSRVEHRP